MVFWDTPRRRLSVVAVALGLLAGACGNSAEPATTATTADASTSTSTSSSSTSSTTSTTLDPNAALIEEVVGAYRRATDAFMEMGRDPDPAHPLIAETTTSAMRQNRIQNLGRLQAAGERLVWPDESVHRIEYIEGSLDVRSADGVVFRACVVDDSWAQSVATGEPSSGRVQTVEVTVAMFREDGVWKLAEQRFDNRMEGVGGCADSWD